MQNFKNIHLLKIVIILVILISFSFSQQGAYKFPILKGEYLGQAIQGDTPELFAPNIISTGIYERDFTMTADGKEIYFGIFNGDLVTIFKTDQKNGVWAEPVVASFANNFNFKYFEPAITADGKRIFFCCTAPKAGEKPLPGYGHQNIWAADRNPDGSWGEIYSLPEQINTDNKEYFPSMTKKGTLYFTRGAKGTRDTEIYRSKYIDGKYKIAESLPDVINKEKNIYNAFIDPDEKYLLAVMGHREDSVTPGRPNYYIFYRSEDDKWSGPINLGKKINFPESGAIAQSVSPDGKYLFFASAKSSLKSQKNISYQWLKKQQVSPQNGNSDIYWVDAKIIKELKPVE